MGSEMCIRDSRSGRPGSLDLSSPERDLVVPWFTENAPAKDEGVNPVLSGAWNVTQPW